MIDLDAFLAKPGFQRLWTLVREKYVQLGRVAGRVRLKALSDEEREALAGLLARNLYGQQQTSVLLSELDGALRRTRFKVSLVECLSRLYPDELTPRRDERRAEAQRFAAFVARAKERVLDTRLSAWLDALGASAAGRLALASDGSTTATDGSGESADAGGGGESDGGDRIAAGDESDDAGGAGPARLAEVVGEEEEEGSPAPEAVADGQAAGSGTPDTPGTPGYRTFLRCYQSALRDGTGESRDLVHALQALEALLQRADLEAEHGGAAEVRLPVLAADITGDPHGFDSDRLAGRMLYWGLIWLDTANAAEALETAWSVRESAPQRGDTWSDRETAAASEGLSAQDRDPGSLMSAASVRSLYARFGVRLDDVSSIVLVAGWPGLAPIPCALTLWALDRLDGAGDLDRVCTDLFAETRRGRAGSDWASRTLFAVENPSIFGAVLDLARRRNEPLPHPIACVSGQPSIAAVRLFDAVVRNGGVIAYSGDMDVKGVEIAARLAARYRDGMILWRMDAAQYERSVTDNCPQLSDAERRQLEGGSPPELCAAIVRGGRKVFQEHLVDELLADYYSH